MANNKASQYDVIVIGAGPAGYVAAIRCAQLGMKTAVVDQWTNNAGGASLGGTCLNVGCIPSKALLDSSHRYAELDELSAHGIAIKQVSIDVASMQQRKEAIVKKLTQGIAGLFKAHKIELHTGRGRLIAADQVQVTADDAKAYSIHGKKIILATGSVPVDLPMIPVDEDRVVNSTGALAFDQCPKRLVVIGGGVIGLELGSVWRRLGAEVTVLEAMSDFLPMADQQVSKVALKSYQSQGIQILVDARVQAVKHLKNHSRVTYENDAGEQHVDADKILVAVGRRPNTSDIAEQSLDLKINDRGFIQVDEHFETSVKGVYAIGDCTAGMMLAHRGSEEGVVLAEQLAGEKSVFEAHLVPSVIYTHPEVAWVGVSEQQAKESGNKYRIGMFPFAASGRALASGEDEGVVKIIADEQTDKILGAHIIGPHASELIAEVVSVMAFEGTTEDIARTIHAHPTLSEAVHEAALDASTGAIHKVSRRSAR